VTWFIFASSIGYDPIPFLTRPRPNSNRAKYEVMAPLKIKNDIAPEKFLYLKLASEVREELERKP